MDKLRHVIAYVQEQPWALHPRILAQMVDLLTYRNAGHRLTLEEIRERIEAAEGDDVKEIQAQQAGAQSMGARRGIAVLPVFGMIAQHSYMVNDISGPRGTSTEAISMALRQAMQDPNVDGIVLNVHSPGGSVYGVGELAAEIRAMRKQKKIVAVANSEMASAAYYIGSAASEVSVTPNGRVGSIGVWSAHEDVSKALEMEGVNITLLSAGKYKVAGNPFEPLSEDGREIMQRDVNHYYDLFVNAVARGREVPVSTVRNGFGEGSMLTAKAALDEGMVDRVETLEEAIQRLDKELRPKRRENAGYIGLDEVTEPETSNTIEIAFDPEAKVETTIEDAETGEKIEEPENADPVDAQEDDEEEREREIAARIRFAELS